MRGKLRYNLPADFQSAMNECGISALRGTQPPATNWNYVLTVMFGMKVRREIKIKFVTLRPKDEKNFINRKTKKS